MPVEEKTREKEEDSWQQQQHQQQQELQALKQRLAQAQQERDVLARVYDKVESWLREFDKANASEPPPTA